MDINIEIKQMRLVDIDSDIIRGSVRRMELHNDPGAEFTMENGWTVTASDVVQAMSDKSEFVRAYKDKENECISG